MCLKAKFKYISRRYSWLVLRTRKTDGRTIRLVSHVDWGVRRGSYDEGRSIFHTEYRTFAGHRMQQLIEPDPLCQNPTHCH